MVERNGGLIRSEPSGLLVPEKRPLTNEDIARMFGPDYRKLIEKKAEQVGIGERLRFFDIPLPHNRSQAVYLAEQFVGDHLVLVPVLGPNMKTSRHSHVAPMVQERYFHIAGESFVKVGGEDLALNDEQNLIEVPLGVVHQVSTKEKSALTLIIMENALLVPSGRLHVEAIQ